MSKRIITILCGGVSPEHDISLLSAKNVVSNLNSDCYQPQVVYLSKDGCWWMLSGADVLLSSKNASDLMNNDSKDRVFPELGSKPAALKSCQDLTKSYQLGLVIPVLHGSGGEDGSVQGLLQLCAVPYVGANILGCAVSMHKAVSKNLLLQSGLPCVPWQSLYINDLPAIKSGDLSIKISLPLFVKPATTGSSIGVVRVSQTEQLLPALDKAFTYADEVLLEPEIKGRELECAVLGSLGRATAPGEVVVDAAYDFYDYKAKYLDKTAAEIIVPAQLQENIAQQLSDLALRAAKALYCISMARVDFFLSDAGEIYINEVNSIPGFTDISMYSKLWLNEGVSAPELLDYLITTADREHRIPPLNMD